MNTQKDNLDDFLNEWYGSAQPKTQPKVQSEEPIVEKKGGLSKEEIDKAFEEINKIYEEALEGKYRDKIDYDF